MTVTLLWHVQNFVVIGRVHFTPEYYKFWSNFEFHQIIISGTGARSEVEVTKTIPFFVPSFSQFFRIIKTLVIYQKVYFAGVDIVQLLYHLSNMNVKTLGCESILEICQEFISNQNPMIPHSSYHQFHLSNHFVIVHRALQLMGLIYHIMCEHSKWFYWQ